MMSKAVEEGGAGVPGGSLSPLTVYVAIMAVATTGPMAPPRFLSMVLIPRPTAVDCLGSDIVTMLTIGIIMQTTPMSANIVSMVRSSAVPRWNTKRVRPVIITSELAKSTGLGPMRATVLPAMGPITSMARVAGAMVSPV